MMQPKEILLNLVMVACVAVAGYSVGRMPIVPSASFSPTPSTVPLPALFASEQLDIALDGRVLRLTGEIDPDAFRRFVLVLDSGIDVRTISLVSTGGSLDAALSIAIVIRSRDLDTEVPAGGVCASSCPLILASGRNRRVGDDAEVGVHQVAMDDTALEHQTIMPPGRLGLATGQAVTGMIAAHLRSMGVDPAIWLVGLSTPPDHIRLLSRQEMWDAALINAG